MVSFYVIQMTFCEHCPNIDNNNDNNNNNMMMMMAPAMGASAADSRGGTTLSWLVPGASQKPGYAAPPASPVVHQVHMTKEDR